MRCDLNTCSRQPAMHHGVRAREFFRRSTNHSRNDSSSSTSSSHPVHFFLILVVRRTMPARGQYGGGKKYKRKKRTNPRSHPRTDPPSHRTTTVRSTAVVQHGTKQEKIIQQQPTNLQCVYDNGTTAIQQKIRGTTRMPETGEGMADKKK